MSGLLTYLSEQDGKTSLNSTLIEKNKGSLLLGEKWMSHLSSKFNLPLGKNSIVHQNLNIKSPLKLKGKFDCIIFSFGN